jgi:hypothetical protein
MQRAIAAKVVEILSESRDLGALDTLSLGIADEDERRTFRRRLGEIMGCLLGSFGVDSARIS